MSLTSDHPDWIRSKCTPEHDKLYGDRLWHWDIAGEYGYKHDDGYTWYRLNCSYWFGDWIEANAKENEQWRAYGARHRAIYIVREDLMTFIKLRWL
jgi:hypothetical protein